MTTGEMEKLVDRHVPTIIDMLPVELPEHGLRRAMTAIKAAFMKIPEDSKAWECHPDSISECVAMAAMTGYSPGLTPLGWAYLVPRWNGRLNCNWLHYMLSWRAWAAECSSNGPGWSLRTGIVYHEDEFSYSQEPPALRHVPNFDAHDFKSTVDEWDSIKAAYAAVDTPSGARYEVLSKYRLERRRAMAQTDKVWGPWPAEMSRCRAAHGAVKAMLFPLSEATRLISGGTLATGATRPDDFDATSTPVAPSPPKAELLPPVIQGDPTPKSDPLRPKAALGAMLLSIQGEDPEGGERSDEERKAQAMALLEELTGKTSVRDLSGETVMATWKALGAHLLAADVEAWLGENDVHEGVLAAFKSGKDAPASQAEEGS
jgi:hypothetical protein